MPRPKGSKNKSTLAKEASSKKNKVKSTVKKSISKEENKLNETCSEEWAIKKEQQAERERKVEEALEEVSTMATDKVAPASFRNEKGQLLPGHPYKFSKDNPPPLKMAKHILAIRSRIKAHANKAVDMLFAIVGNEEESTRDRMQAAKILLDYILPTPKPINWDEEEHVAEALQGDSVQGVYEASQQVINDCLTGKISTSHAEHLQKLLMGHKSIIEMRDYEPVIHTLRLQQTKG